MPGQESIHDARNHRILVTDNIWEKRLAADQFLDQVSPHLILDGSIGARLSLSLEFAKRCWFGFHDVGKPGFWLKTAKVSGVG